MSHTIGVVWTPPDNAEKFVHSSINYCDEMDTHNVILDYDAIVTGTAGITDHPLLSATQQINMEEST